MAKNNTTEFLNYLKEQGLSRKEYKHILEVLNQAPNSLARYLRGMDIFLLNNLVNKEELIEYGINGETGLLTEEGIILPKKISRIYEEEGLRKPDIKDFDLIMGNGISITSFNASYFPQDKLFGFCEDESSPILGLRLERAKSLLQAYNNSSYPGYEMLKDTSKGKAYCLIRKK